MDINIDEVKKKLTDLFRLSDELTKLTGRPFTPDGHMVGSAGEVLAAYHFDFLLEDPSNPDFDATTKSECKYKVEIKTTGGKRSVAFGWKSAPVAEKVLVLRLDQQSEDGFEEVYNGNASPVWELLKGLKVQKTGQRRLALNNLRELSEKQPSSEKMARCL